MDEISINLQRRTLPTIFHVLFSFTWTDARKLHTKFYEQIVCSMRSEARGSGKGEKLKKKELSLVYSFTTIIEFQKLCALFRYSMGMVQILAQILASSHHPFFV